jgi:putative ABC transport system permease protein
MPGFFHTLGVPLLEGRYFNENDAIGSFPVIIISKRTAETLFPGESAVGRKVRFGINEEYDPWSTVIGVVGNVRFNAAERDPGYEVYWSYRQYPGPGIRFVVRTTADPMTLMPRIKEAIQQTNPNISVDRIVAMDGLVTESIWRRRLWGAILSAFAALALLLATVGLYGVMSYVVAQQRKEIGIRLAIGAPPGQILRWALRRGMVLALTGLVVGLGAAMAAARVLGDLLFGISGGDLTTYGAVSAILVATAFFACLIPAIRATKVDPITALRQE